MDDDLYRHCPFCSSGSLRITEWWDDDGTFDAVECDQCKGSAPKSVWNKRAPIQRTASGLAPRTTIRTENAH